MAIGNARRTASGKPTELPGQTGTLIPQQVNLPWATPGMGTNPYHNSNLNTMLSSLKELYPNQSPDKSYNMMRAGFLAPPQGKVNSKGQWVPSGGGAGAAQGNVQGSGLGKTPGTVQGNAQSTALGNSSNKEQEGRSFSSRTTGDSVGIKGLPGDQGTPGQKGLIGVNKGAPGISRPGSTSVIGGSAIDKAREFIGDSRGNAWDTRANENRASGAISSWKRWDETLGKFVDSNSRSTSSMGMDSVSSLADWAKNNSIDLASAYLDSFRLDDSKQGFTSSGGVSGIFNDNNISDYFVTKDNSIYHSEDLNRYWDATSSGYAGIYDGGPINRVLRDLTDQSTTFYKLGQAPSSARDSSSGISVTTPGVEDGNFTPEDIKINNMLDQYPQLRSAGLTLNRSQNLDPVRQLADLYVQDAQTFRNIHTGLFGEEGENILPTDYLLGKR